MQRLISLPTLLALALGTAACQDTSAIPPTSQAGAALPTGLEASKQVPKIETPETNSKPSAAKLEPAKPSIDHGNPAGVITMDENKGDLSKAAKGFAINPSPVPLSEQTPGKKAAGAKGKATKGQPGPGATDSPTGPKLTVDNLDSIPNLDDEEEGMQVIPSETLKGEKKLKPIEPPVQVQ